MSYKFNDGDGAVICDVCYTMIDENIGYAEYMEIYGGNEDICWECNGKAKKEKKVKVDILDDGWRN